MRVCDPIRTVPTSGPNGVIPRMFELDDVEKRFLDDMVFKLAKDCYRLPVSATTDCRRVTACAEGMAERGFNWEEIGEFIRNELGALKGRSIIGGEQYN